MSGLYGWPGGPGGPGGGAVAARALRAADGCVAYLRERRPEGLPRVRTEIESDAVAAA